MKKHSILFLALLAAVSCQKENTQDIAPVFDSNAELRASFDEQSSRIATEDGLTFSLEEGKEQIGVYINLGDTPLYENVLYTAGSADEQGWIAFSTQVPVHVQSNSKFFAYAPYSATTVDVSGSTDDSVIEPAAAGSGWNGKRAINLPDLQEQPAAGVKTDIAKYYSVVAAPATPVARDVLESYSVNLQFSGIFALVRFGLNNFTEGEIKVSKLVFSAENAALTGYFSVDLTHENPKLSNTEYAPEAIAGKTFDKVTVTLAEPATIAAQEMAEVYAVVNACAVTAPKLTVYATDAEGKDIVFEKTLSDKTFSRQQRTAIGVKLENPVVADYAQEVIDALKNGGTVKIEKNVDLSGKGNIEIPAGTTVDLEIPAGIEVVLGENTILNNGSTTISGNGTITATDSVITNCANAELKIDGGTFVTTSFLKKTSAIRNEEGGILTINDCNVDAVHHAVTNFGTMTLHGGNIASSSSNQNKDEAGTSYYAYAVVSSGENAFITIDSDNVIINGIQGALSITNKSKAEISGGIFSTYAPNNFYGLYVAMDGEAMISGGHFYAEGNNKNCVFIGNEDIVTATFGKPVLCGGYYSNQGYSGKTGTALKPAEGYKWVELAEPLVITNEINGKTNTYYYQIVEGEDLGYKEVEGGYEIYSTQGMQWLAEQVNGGNNFSGKTVTLTANIDLSGIEWTPIGTKDAPFAGTFDGGSKTISNLNVNSPEEAFKGLFGRLVDHGTISNVNIDNATVKGLSQVGAIVGSAYTGSVSNCHVSGDIAIEGNYQVGGIAGNGYATISDCSVTGNAGSYVKGTYKENNLEGDAVGGIIGYAGEEHTENDVISGCSATIDVSGTRKVGGIAGQCGHTANLGSCTFSGNVATNADETYIAGNAGKIMVGGLVGELTNDGGTPPLCALYIRNCTVAEGSTVTGVDAKTTGAILGGSRTAGYTLTEENNTTTGVTVIPGGGNGTIAEGIELTPDGTYNIVSAAGVKSLAELVNAGDNFEGKTIVLTADANLGGEEWTPIGIGTREGSTYTGNAFKGTFDGNGKTISGLKISERSNSAGLIGVLDGGTVKNVTLNVDIDVAATRNESAAGCVGLLTNNGLVENVTVNGSVKSEKAAAGIVSRVLKSGTVRNCHNHATISGTSYNIGGIVGAAYYDNEGMTIEGCTNDGAVSGTLAVGGIAGLSAAEVKNCSNSATVTGNGTSVGGVIGEQQNAGSITGCTNTGNVKNNTEAYGNGGIVGWIRYSGGTTNYPHMNIITVSGCENRGSVSGGNDAGGIVGTVYNHGVVDNNRNYAPTLSAKTFVAGVVGNVQFDTTADGITDEQHVYVTNNYSETTLDNMTGGLKAKFVYINNSDKTTDSGNTPDDGVQVSTAEEAIAAIQGGGKVTVAGAIDKIDFTTLNPTAPVELVLNAKVGEIVLGSSASNPAQTTITVAKDVDYPTFSVAKEKDIQNLTIIGDPTSSKACTSGINALNQGITTVKNVTIKGVRFQGKGVHFGFTANPQTTQSIVVEECEGIDMVEPLFYTSNNEYVNTHVGDITIRNNKATFSASAANTVNALYICVTTTGTVLIENNTFINPPKHGIMASSNACENFIVRGNTFTNPVEDGVKIDYPINNVVIENNTITPTEYGIRIARFKSDYNPTVTISGNNIDMSNTKDAKFNGISIAPNEANGQAKLVIKENVKVAGNVTEWFSINSALVLNEGSDVATPFNN